MKVRIEELICPYRIAGCSFKRLEIETLETVPPSSFFSHRLKVVTSSSGS